MEKDIFCQIVAGDIPSPRIYENKSVIVIRDINPKAPVHDLIITKKHIEMLEDLTEADSGIIADILLAAKEVVKIEGIEKKGYRLISNYGKDGGPLVKHMHFHILGGKSLGPKLLTTDK